MGPGVIGPECQRVISACARVTPGVNKASSAGV